MFKLFGKKKDAAPEEAAPQQEAAMPAINPALDTQFSPEERTILAVTGPEGFVGFRNDDSTTRTASIILSAWVEEDGDNVHQKPTPMLALADDTLLSYLRARVPRDFIIKVRVRLAVDGSRLLMTGLPQPAFDPELKAILDQQKAPQQVEDETLGVFALNRSLGWFQGEVDWLEEPALVGFAQEENSAACLETAHGLLADPAGWDDKVRSFAVGQLADGDEEFLSRLMLDSIQVHEDGRFEFWFSDGEMEWDFAVCISGTLSDGPDNARKEV